MLIPSKDTQQSRFEKKFSKLDIKCIYKNQGWRASSVGKVSVAQGLQFGFLVPT